MSRFFSSFARNLEVRCRERGYALFIMKLRMVKFARTPEYQNLFSGDPQWVTESIGGMGVDGDVYKRQTRAGDGAAGRIAGLAKR